MKYIIALVLYTTTFSFASDIYQYKDSKGNIVYTNKLVKGATKVKLPPLSVYAAPMTKADIQAKNYTTYGNYSNVTKKPTTHNSKIANFGTNEQGRHYILNDELKKETQALKDAQQALIEGKNIRLGTESKNIVAYNARTQALQDAVTEHQKNIEILTKQLSE